MNKNMVVILGGALFVAIFAALLVQSGLSPKEEPEVVEIKKVEVLVASKDITVGTQLGGSNLRWREWPEETSFAGAILRQGDQDAEEALTGRALRNIDEGEPVTRSSVVKETRGNFVAAALEDGMRAFAIKVSADTAAGGFISPGDYVDVILTHRITLPNDERARELAQQIITETASETIVRAVKVLAIDQESKPTEEAVKVRTITLQVTPDQAESLALGGEMGKLSLSLRKLGEKEVGEAEVKRLTPFVTDNSASRVLQKVVGVVDSPSATDGAEVRLYSGNQAENVQVRVPNKDQNVELQD